MCDRKTNATKAHHRQEQQARRSTVLYPISWLKCQSLSRDPTFRRTSTPLATRFPPCPVHIRKSHQITISHDFEQLIRGPPTTRRKCSKISVTACHGSTDFKKGQTGETEGRKLGCIFRSNSTYSFLDFGASRVHCGSHVYLYFCSLQLVSQELTFTSYCLTLKLECYDMLPVLGVP